MKTKKEEMFNVLSENEQKKVIAVCFHLPRKRVKINFPIKSI